MRGAARGICAGCSVVVLQTKIRRSSRPLADEIDLAPPVERQHTRSGDVERAVGQTGLVDRLSSELLGFAADKRVLIVNCDDFGTRAVARRAGKCLEMRVLRSRALKDLRPTWPVIPFRGLAARSGPCGDSRLILARDLRRMRRSRRSLCQIHLLICRSFTGATGLEPATSGVTGRRSNQLNYAPEGSRSLARASRRPPRATCAAAAH